MNQSFYDWCTEHNRQDLLDRWDYDLNKYDPKKIGYKSNHRIYFKCQNKKHASRDIILSSIAHLGHNCDCKLCYLDTSSFGVWCENNKPHLLDVWDHELNDCSPYDISYAVSDKYFFKCSNGMHSVPKQISKITLRGDDIYCIACDLEEHSFYAWCVKNNPALLDLWDYDKNKVSPKEILCRSGKKYWFKCPRGLHQSEEYRLANVTRDSGKILCQKCNSIGQYILDHFGDNGLSLLWDYELNTVDPFEISYGNSRDKIYIKCIENPNHKSHYVSPSNFTKGRGCPECKQENNTSKLQRKVEQYISQEHGYENLHEYACSIIARNPINGYLLPYDNDVMVSDKHLVIEVHGNQHYEVTGWTLLAAKSTGKTPEEVLEYRQYRDKIKKDYALSQGYHYLEIPYWTEFDNSYKTLIDNAIHKILNP